jgi:biopolymer transport protein ExbD/biopolymer transport protein TolR
MLTNRLDKECFLRADQRAKYQTVLDVVQSLQSSGVDQLGLLTEQVEGRRPATRVAQ